jgi:hypothetical protein
LNIIFIYLKYLKYIVLLNLYLMYIIKKILIQLLGDIAKIIK